MPNCDCARAITGLQQRANVRTWSPPLSHVRWRHSYGRSHERSNRCGSLRKELLLYSFCEILVLNAATEGDFHTTFARLAQGAAGALAVGADPFFVSRRSQI